MQNSIKRVLVITLASLCGFVVLQFFDPKLQPHGEPVAGYAAIIAGGCFLPWLFGVLIAKCGRGWGSTVGGLIAVVVIDGLVLVGTVSDSWVQEKPTKQQLPADVTQAAAEFEGMLTNALSRSGLTPTQVSTAMAAVAAVYAPITEGFQDTRELEKIMTTQAFTRPVNWKTRNDLAANRAVCEKYKQACARLIARTSRLKADTIEELRRRGFDLAEASRTADIFFSDRGTEGSHELVQIDIKLTDISIAQIDLLSSHFGEWTIKNGSPEFSDSQLSKQWSETLNESSRLKEAQEALAHKLISNQ
jgi:hypothetical protein